MIHRIKIFSFFPTITVFLTVSFLVYFSNSPASTNRWPRPWPKPTKPLRRLPLSRSVRLLPLALLPPSADLSSRTSPWFVSTANSRVIFLLAVRPARSPPRRPIRPSRRSKRLLFFLDPLSSQINIVLLFVSFSPLFQGGRFLLCFLPAGFFYSKLYQRSFNQSFSRLFTSILGCRLIFPDVLSSVFFKTAIW